MDEKIKYMLLKTVQDDNILPLTSVCNLACQFCSHQGNPPGLKVYSFGHLKLALIKELIDYLSPKGLVIIGESATRIIEGEPFCHPQIKEILQLIRSKFPQKTIQITTNGSFFSSELINFLFKLKKIKLNISLNCSSPKERVFLMKDKNARNVFEGLQCIKEKNIPFTVSIVAMPHLMGWSSIVNTIQFILEYCPETIRIFLPGFTKYTSAKLKFKTDEIYQGLRSLIAKLNDKEKIKVPIMLEPPLLTNLQAEVAGIIPNSIVEGQLKRNDLILTVNHKKVFSRVDAFNRILKAKDPVIKFVRNNQKEELKLYKEKEEKVGLVFNYDLDPEVFKQLKCILSKSKAKTILIITSLLAKEIMLELLRLLNKEYISKRTELLVVENKYMAGSIMATGLLVNEDIIKAIKKTEKKYDLIIIPSIIYDIFGNDLTGNNFQTLSQILETEVMSL